MAYVIERPMKDGTRRYTGVYKTPDGKYKSAGSYDTHERAIQIAEEAERHVFSLLEETRPSDKATTTIQEFALQRIPTFHTAGPASRRGPSHSRPWSPRAGRSTSTAPRAPATASDAPAPTANSTPPNTNAPGDAKKPKNKHGSVPPPGPISGARTEQSSSATTSGTASGTKPAGLPEGFTPYNAHHTVISWAIDQGIDLQKVRQRAGHGSLSVTSRYAAILNEEDTTLETIFDTFNR